MMTVELDHYSDIIAEIKARLPYISLVFMRTSRIATRRLLNIIENKTITGLYIVHRTIVFIRCVRRLLGGRTLDNTFLTICILDSLFV